ncbi:MAG: hypothetical protein AAB513_01665 [Patescibacteria group bacterium]
MNTLFPKTKKEIKFKFNFDGWCFAIVNNRLAEVYFDNDDKNKKSNIWAHCYVKKSEYKTKREQKMILEDTKKCKFSYRNKKYKRVDKK